MDKKDASEQRKGEGEDKLGFLYKNLFDP